MKLAFCVESESDEAQLAAFVKRIVAEEVQAHPRAWRVRGFTGAIHVAHALAWQAYHSGLDGAIFAIDNDGQPRHEDHGGDQTAAGCRHCALRAAAKVDAILTKPRPELAPLQFVFVVPVETIEAWLLFAKTGSSKGFERGVDRRQLKRDVYELERPTTRQMIEIGVPIAEQADVAKLRAASKSFDLFVRDLLAARSSLASPND